MSTLTCRYLIVRLGLDCVNDIRKFDSVLDEKDWDVVSDDVPVAFFGVEFDGKATDVANCVLNGELAKAYERLL